MNIRSLLGILFILFATSVFADPPSIVGRLSYLEGSVSLSTRGGDWMDAVLNRPVIPGDSLWADANAKAELQLDAAALRITDGTELRLTTLNRDTAQFELPQGKLYLHVPKLVSTQVYEIDTPNAVFTTTEPGSYFIEVDAQSNTTTVSVFAGVGNLYGKTDESATLIAPNTYVLKDSDITQLQTMDLIPTDDFIAWCQARDEKFDQAFSQPPVAPRVVGYSDLQQYGSWIDDPDYGHIWSPGNVAEDWAPYREGHWVVIEPWGWTWIDDAPWGFAPYHYGRWIFLSGHWYWVPGPIDVEPVYAPALVVFIGSGDYYAEGNDFIAWFPLGPGEPYIPPYVVSINYFISINISNTQITNVNKFYNKYDANLSYKNAGFAQAITAVKKDAFLNQRNLKKDILPMPKDQLKKLKYTQKIQLQPNGISKGQTTKIMPPKNVLDKKVIMKTRPAKIIEPTSVEKIKVRPAIVPKDSQPPMMHLPADKKIPPPKVRPRPTDDAGLPPALLHEEKKKLPQPVRLQRPLPSVEQSAEPKEIRERPRPQKPLNIYQTPQAPSEPKEKPIYRPRFDETHRIQEMHKERQRPERIHREVPVQVKPVEVAPVEVRPVEVTPPNAVVITPPPPPEAAPSAVILPPPAAANPQVIEEIKKRKKERDKNND